MGGLQEYRRITPMALSALQAAADTGEPRVRLNPWRDRPPQGSARRLRLHVAEHRLRGGAGEHRRVRSSSRRMPARISIPRRGSARRELLSSLAAGEGWRQRGSADGMQGRGAALDIALAELAFRLGEGPHVGTKRRNTGRSAGAAKRPTISAPRPVRPRPLPLPARPSAAPAEMTEQAKHQALLVDRLRHMVVHARRQGGLRGRPARRWRSWRDRQPGEAPSARILQVASRPSISGIHVHPAPRRTARSPPAPAERPPARRRRGPERPRAAQRLGGDGGSARCPPLPADARPATAGCAPPAPCSPCNAMQHRVGQLLRRDRLGEKIDEGRRAGRAHRPAPRGHRR